MGQLATCSASAIGRCQCHASRRRRSGCTSAGTRTLRFMIPAGVNAKTLSAYLGHASITVTLDRYGHLFPGTESEAAALLDAYLDQDG